MVSLKDVAKHAGVSVETVSRVLKGKYKGRTERSRMLMEQVLKSAEELQYRPNTAARATRTQQSGLVGIVVERAALLTHPVFTETLKGISESLEEDGYVLTITSLEGIEDSTLAKKIFQEHVLDGIFIVGDIPSAQIDAMAQIIPTCVKINTNCFEALCCVRRDEFSAGETAGEELRKLGYQKAIYFDVTEDPDRTEYHYSVAERLAGFRQGFAGGEVDALNLNTGQIFQYLKEHEAELAKDTVVVSATDLRLFCIMSALTRLSVRVGDDFGLASLDDETGLLSSYPELSRVMFERITIGREAGRMMTALLAGNREECKSVALKGKWLGGKTTPGI